MNPYHSNQNFRIYADTDNCACGRKSMQERCSFSGRSCQNQKTGQNCCLMLDSHSLCPENRFHERSARARQDAPDKAALLDEINACSFAISDILLYLDTHPCDTDALAYFKKHLRKRISALNEYAKYFGPLTIDTADDEASRSFEWAETPWPWEGGDC